MEKFEHKFVELFATPNILEYGIHNKILEFLDSYGNLGWEVISLPDISTIALFVRAIQDCDGDFVKIGNVRLSFYFKRKK